MGFSNGGGKLPYVLDRYTLQLNTKDKSIAPFFKVSKQNVQEKTWDELQTASQVDGVLFGFSVFDDVNKKDGKVTKKFSLTLVDLDSGQHLKVVSSFSITGKALVNRIINMVKTQELSVDKKVNLNIGTLKDKDKEVKQDKNGNDMYTVYISYGDELVDQFMAPGYDMDNKKFVVRDDDPNAEYTKKFIEKIEQTMEMSTGKPTEMFLYDLCEELEISEIVKEFRKNELDPLLTAKFGSAEGSTVAKTSAPAESKAKQPEQEQQKNKSVENEEVPDSEPESNTVDEEELDELPF